jgi:hypothetical protein
MQQVIAEAAESRSEGFWPQASSDAEIRGIQSVIDQMLGAIWRLKQVTG